MKNLHPCQFFIILLMFSSFVQAKHVPVDTAKKVAINCMNRTKAINGPSKKLSLNDISHSYTANKKNVDTYYVFNLSPAGWIIVSADDAASPVIAYSTEDTYDPNILNQPPAFIEWMDNAASQIADAASKNLKARTKDESQWKQLSTEPDNLKDSEILTTTMMIGPLIQTHWDQGSGTDWWPWDYSGNSEYCPWEYTDWSHLERKYCPTGCIATAMGQIMKYWQWPPIGCGSHGYDPDYSCSHDCSGFGYRYVNFANQNYNWSDSSMPLNGYSNAIALLMRDLGVAVEMDYTPSDSGSYPSIARDAFSNYFRYLWGTYAERNYSDTAGWIASLKAELNAGRPFLYTGQWVGNHAFVCDGYDSSDYFHFNWGWGGSYDGMFSVNDLTPGGYDFRYNNVAILGVEPLPFAEFYVDANYTPSGFNDGYIWGLNAFNKIQDAINNIYSEGVIYVNPGIYYEAIDLLGKPIHLYGLGSPDSIIIYGNGANHVIKCVNYEADDTIIENFTIAGGYAHGSTNVEKSGGGMLNYYSNPTIINCIFNSNWALLHGGGMCNEHSTPTVIDCIFTDNIAGVHGGGVMDNFNPDYSTIINCLFKNNSAGGGGGGHCDSGGYSNLYNCTFSGNSAQLGGAIYSWSGSTHLYNCLVWGNHPAEIISDSSTITANYSDVNGGWAGIGNINLNPHFLSDFTLDLASPCLDAGNNDYLPTDITMDLAGAARFVDSCRNDTGSGTPPIVDMGAYEYQKTWSVDRNMLMNHDFEMGDTIRWDALNFYASTEQAHGGLYSGLAVGRTASWQGARQEVYFVGDKTYRVSGWVRLQNTDSNHVAIDIYDINGSFYYNVANGTAYNDRWTLLDGTFPIYQSKFYYVSFDGPARDVNFFVDDTGVFELKGDFDSNGNIDFFDFSVFASYYEFDCSIQNCGHANLEDCDNTVNEFDLAILLKNWLADI